MTVRWTPEMDAALVDCRRKAWGLRRTGERIGVSDTVVKRRTIERGMLLWDSAGGPIRGDDPRFAGGLKR